MFTERLINYLLEPINESVHLLHSVHAKLDAQALGKLRSALELLQLTVGAKRKDTMTLTLALQSLSELSTYYLTLIQQAERASDPDLSHVSDLVRFLSGSLRDLAGLKGGRMNQVMLPLIEARECACLWIVALLGKIACLQALGYAGPIIDEQVRLLRTAELNFEFDRSTLFGLAQREKLLPPAVAALSPEAFTARYGPLLTSAHLKVQLDDPDNPLEKLLMQHLLYWADRDQLRRWVAADLRYAALRAHLVRAKTVDALLAPPALL